MMMMMNCEASLSWPNSVRSPSSATCCSMPHDIITIDRSDKQTPTNNDGDILENVHGSHQQTSSNNGRENTWKCSWFRPANIPKMWQNPWKHSWFSWVNTNQQWWWHSWTVVVQISKHQPTMVGTPVKTFMVQTNKQPTNNGGNTLEQSWFRSANTNQQWLVVTHLNSHGSDQQTPTNNGWWWHTWTVMVQVSKH